MQAKKILFWAIGGVALCAIAIVVLVTSAAYLKRASFGRLRGDMDYSSESGTAQVAAYRRSEMKEKALGLSSPMTTTSTGSSAPVVRKLIKTAELSLEVKDCQQTAQKINSIVESLSGIIIDSQIQKYQNESKRGWTVFKVAPKDFNTVLAKLKELGKLDSERVTGEDITEEYIDLEARLKNFQLVRQRLLKILDERAREVKDILEVERELARLGEQIEVIEGRMKYLDRQVDLSTITVNYYESKAVTPEPFNVLKRFKETIRTAIEAFINVFNGAIVVIAVILPIIIWLFIIFLIVILIKKIFNR